MSRLELEVVEWLGGTADAEDATFGSLRIGVDGVALTEVEDQRARATRPTIRVSASQVAEWLVCHYWRLVWEPRPPARPEPTWSMAHSLAAIGGGTAWPDLRIWGDGEFVDIEMTAESRTDVAAIRYLQTRRVVLARSNFDAAVQRFVEHVETRLAATVPSDTALADLRAEWDAERRDPDLSAWCRREARAGFDAGDAPPEWRQGFSRLAAAAGEAAAEEMLAAGCVDELEATVEAMRAANRTASLPALATLADAGAGQPWERGVRLARAARRTLGLPDGVLSNARLSEVLGVSFPLEPNTQRRGLLGAHRRADDARAAVLVRGRRSTSQRFYFARLLAAAIVAPEADRVLPISDAATSTQKLTRAFAAELLVPWDELDAWTDEHGVGEASIEEAAERYDVSSLLIETSLVNRHKLDRAAVSDA